jgi:uncharacterized membrane protein YfcA
LFGTPHPPFSEGRMTAHALLILTMNLGLGVVLGGVGGLLGIGGGLIAIPILVFLYGMDQHLAQGTALVMITPNVLIGFIRYRQRNPIDLRATFWMCVLAMVTAAIAAHYAGALEAGHLRTGFALFLFLLAAYFIWQIRARPQDQPPRHWPVRYVPAIGLLSGAMSGLFTIGGGMVAVPALVSLFGMRQTKAQGIALALVIPASVVALATYGYAGNVNWQVGLPLAAGGLVSVSWGVALAHRFSPARLRIAFCSVLVGTAVLLLLQP